MLRPERGVVIRMAIIVVLAYGGSFVVRGITTAMTDLVTVVRSASLR